MSLQNRLALLAGAIGADIKALNGSIASSTVAQELPRVVGAVGQPAFLNSWANQGGYVTTFRKDILGKVRITGVVTGGAAGTAIFTLPAGYRPPTADKSWACVSSGNTVGSVYIGTNGQVTCLSKPGTFLYLDVIEFDTELVNSLAILAPKGDKGDTGATGEVTTQALKDATAAIGAFSASPSATSPARAGASWPIDLGNEIYDVSGWFNPATGRYTPKKAGFYLLHGHIHVNTQMVNGRLMCGIAKNGAPRYGTCVYPYIGDDNRTDVTRLVYANGTTDYFTFYWNHTSSSSHTISIESEFFGHFLGAELDTIVQV